MSELNEFLKLLAEGKKNTPTARAKKIEDQVKLNVKSDLSSLFSELSSLKEQKEQLVKQNPELVKQISEEVINEVAPLPTPIGQIPAEQQIKPKSNSSFDMDEISKYLSATAPKEDKENPFSEYAVINKKIKFLEQWVGKIQNAGPGSGEVNFRYLDDVTRDTMTSANNNWVLEYNSSTKKVQFTEDIGPIQTIWFDPNHIDTANDTGLLNWNSQDRTLNLHHPDGVTQQIGQELYYLVKNTTASPILNGMTVRFGGGTPVDGEARIVAFPFLANGSFSNLYVMGIATQDIAAGEEGLITTFGKVRELNTTGTPVGETWVVGDILYASATTAGALTKFKPTSPNNVNPMAAVLKLGVTDGEIFVRPTIEQQSNYAEFVDTTDHIPASPNTPYPITFDTTVVARGFRSNGAGLPTSTITCEVSGRYQITAELSLTSTNSSAKEFYIWVRKNGVNVPLSARRQTLAGNGVYSVVAYALTISLNANDIIELMYAASDVTVIIDAPIATAFSPTIPSVAMLIVQVAQ